MDLKLLGLLSFLLISISGRCQAFLKFIFASFIVQVTFVFNHLVALLSGAHILDLVGHALVESLELIGLVITQIKLHNVEDFVEPLLLDLGAWYFNLLGFLAARF